MENPASVYILRVIMLWPSGLARTIAEWPEPTSLMDWVYTLSTSTMAKFPQRPPFSRNWYCWLEGSYLTNSCLAVMQEEVVEGEMARIPGSAVRNLLKSRTCPSQLMEMAGWISNTWFGLDGPPPLV